MKPIMIIDPSINAPEVSCYNDLQKQSYTRLEYFMPPITGCDDLNSKRIDQYGGVIIFGSNCSVYDHKPWQSDIVRIIKQAVKLKIPLLGICYGHQLMAHAFGGKVEKNPNATTESGLREVSFNDVSKIQLKSNSGKLVVSHGERVAEPPKGWKIWAQSPLIKVEGLSHESSPAWSVQAHPEANDVFTSNQNFTLKNIPERFDFGRELTRAFFDFCENQPDARVS